MSTATVTGVVLIVIAQSIHATPVRAQWDVLGDHRQLVAKTVVDVGEVSERSATTFGRYVDDPILKMRRWIPGETVRWTEFTGGQAICFREGLHFSSTFNGALLLRDRDSITYIAELNPSIPYSLTVKVESVTPIACPKPSVGGRESGPFLQETGGAVANRRQKVALPQLVCLGRLGIYKWPQRLAAPRSTSFSKVAGA